MACRKLFQLPAAQLRAIRSLSGSAAVRASSASSDEPQANLTTKTHTGQVFEEKDYRNVRFQNSTRLVNENWGINLIAEIPPQECTERVVSCNGGDGPLGHPKVYINLDKPGDHSCGYCGLRFVKKAGHHH